MSSVPEATKKPIVTVDMKVTFEGKEKMGLSDMAELNRKIQMLVVEAKKLGTVSGDVSVGKQKFNLEA